MDDVTLLCQLYSNGESTADRLRAVGYGTLESISESQAAPLASNAGLSIGAVRKLITAATEMLNPVARTINTELLGLGEDEHESYQEELTKGVTLDESAALDGLTISAAPVIQDSDILDNVYAKPDSGKSEPADEPESNSKQMESILSIREQLVDLVALSIINGLQTSP